jgi:hypothetical protein
MELKLTFEQLDEIVREGHDVELEGEKYIHESELPSEMDDHGIAETHIYKRESDGKYFRIDLYLVRYGHEWYEFESDYNDGELTEVEKREVSVVKWVTK